MPFLDLDLLFNLLTVDGRNDRVSPGLEPTQLLVAGQLLLGSTGVSQDEDGIRRNGDEETATAPLRGLRGLLSLPLLTLLPLSLRCGEDGVVLPRLDGERVCGNHGLGIPCSIDFYLVVTGRNHHVTGNRTGSDPFECRIAPEVDIDIGTVL